MLERAKEATRYGKYTGVEYARFADGFGWTRWSRDWLYETLGLFNDYRAVRLAPKVAPAG